MDEIIELVSCCGWVLRSRHDEEKKARFDNEMTFMDIWYGKKRKIVVGIYDPDKKLMKYERPSNLIELEKLITK